MTFNPELGCQYDQALRLTIITPSGIKYKYLIPLPLIVHEPSDNHRSSLVVVGDSRNAAVY